MVLFFLKALYENSLKSKYLENRNFSVTNMLVHALFFFFFCKNRILRIISIIIDDIKKLLS